MPALMDKQCTPKAPRLSGSVARAVLSPRIAVEAAGGRLGIFGTRRLDGSAGNPSAPRDFRLAIAAQTRLGGR
jgi:hypothetical protein